MSEDGGVTYNLQNLLTNIASRLGQLEGTVKTFMENWARQDQLANDGRRIIHERLDLVGRQIERVATDVTNVQQDLAEIKKELDEEVGPVIKTFEGVRHQKIGAKGVWAMIGAAVVATGSIVAFAVDRLMGLVFPKP